MFLLYFRRLRLGFAVRQVGRDVLEHLRRRNALHAARRGAAIRNDGVDEFRAGQSRRRAEQTEGFRAAGCREVQRPRTRADEKIVKTQKCGRLRQSKRAGVDGLRESAGLN